MNYIEKYTYDIASKKIDDLGKWISDIAAVGSCEKIVVWGATKTTEYLLKFTDLGKKLVTYVDRSKITFQGQDVFKPTEINFAEYPYVLIGSPRFQQEIADELTEKYHYTGTIIKSHFSSDDLPFWQYYINNLNKSQTGGWYTIVRTVYDSVLAVMIKILRAREIISSIDNEARIGIYGDEIHLDYLRKFTALPDKNVCCLLNDSAMATDPLHCAKPKAIQNLNLDVVIVAKLKDCDKFLREIQDKYTGEIITFYAPDSKSEFFECDFSNLEEQLALERDAVSFVANSFCEEISQSGNYFVNFTAYNKYSNDSPLNYFYETDWRYDDCAIIIQGPIAYKDDFTYHTILQYMKLFPGVNIVVSTWEECAADDGFAKIKSIPGIHIVLCEKLADPGAANSRLQMYTTYSGLEYAKNHLEIEYALKIRSDSRLYSCEALELMKFFSDFGFDSQNANGRKGRIVCNVALCRTNLDHSKMRNIMTDYYNFGHIEDMLKFWNPAVINNNAAYYYIDRKSDYSPNAETFLYTRYVYAYTPWHNREENRLIPWEEFYGFLPLSAIDFVWNKYRYMSIDFCRFASILNEQREILGESGLASWTGWLNKLVESGQNKKRTSNEEALDV